MTQTDRCPECGADRSVGICPRCLVRLGIEGPGPGRSGRSFPGDPTRHRGDGTTIAGVLETIAASIGPVPRALLRATVPGEQLGPIFRPGGGGDSPIRYRIDGEIARGGMGAVLKGRDPDLGRDVAIKVLRDDYRDDADMVRRFIEEAQIGGQLQHPGIVPIYELGTFPDRRPFFAMKLVKGRTLEQLLGAEALETDRARLLSIFEAVCQTVAYAHARGVIHRDLKPSNVMVGSFGEVQVMDWGLAKVLPCGGVADEARAGPPGLQETVIATARSGSDGPGLSRAGSAMGTPSYMAPEQARGELDRVDERADVFALGSILCEILTGHSAFLGRSSGEIMRQAAMGDTAEVLARLDSCGADAELIAIAKGCLAREPEDRPRHAGTVAGRVTAYLAGVQQRLRAAEVARAAESARAEEAVERARAERRARRLQVGLAASLLLLTTAGGLTFTHLLHLEQERAARFGRILAETTALRDKARREPGDPGLWREALMALERAEGQGPGARVVALRDEIQRGLDEAERDARLRQELVEIRANSLVVFEEDTDAAYATAFGAAGMDLDALEPGEFARRLRLQREEVVIELSAFLDDWSAVRRKSRRPVAAWRKPLEAARLADPDPYRDHLRAILLAEDRRPQEGALKALAAAPEASDLPAPSAVLLGQALLDLGQAEAAVALLRPAAIRHPGDVWVNFALAGALDRSHPAAREEALRYYTAARALRPETAHGLADLLMRMGRGAEAEAVFRDLANRRPRDEFYLVSLGHYLERSGRGADAAPVLERAIAAGREAIRLKPDGAKAHYNLGVALADQGRRDEAVDEYRAATRLDPDLAEAHNNLGAALVEQGKRGEAIAEFRAAIRLKPSYAEAHCGLGSALWHQGKRDEAIAEYRAAIRLKPDLAEAHHDLGNALAAQGKREEAVAECREAIRLKPDNAAAHYNLGASLAVQGKREEAIAEYRAAIRLDPDFAMAHHSLGNALAAQGKREEAVAEYRTAIRFKPDDALAHNNLGLILWEQGRRDEAIVAFRAAIRFEPNDAAAHCSLGRALRRQGDYAGALAMLRRGHELGSRQPGWGYPSARWVAETERMVALAPRLPALLKGEDRPKDVAERLTFARMCYEADRPATAARLWAEALAANPKLGEDRRASQRYNAACAAALAAAGEGVDDPKPDEIARAEFRGQALDWLRVELAAWTKVLESGDAQARSSVQGRIQHWQTDPDLACVRGADALAKLPEAERAAWRSLWAEVDALLARSRVGRP